MKQNVITPLYFVILILFALIGCSQVPGDASPSRPEIILATTTSTYDSGLLDVLIPVFEDKFGYVVKIISVGTGKALAMGEGGNADVLLVHAPPAEIKFMTEGYGIERTLVMHNDFLFVGPADDPAMVRGLGKPPKVLAAIADHQALFASRGDDSGTHKNERAFWQIAGINPEGEWYLETGQGMGSTLQIATEKGAYTLTDRATFLSLQDVLSLEILVEGDPTLLNIYHTMIVNPEHWPGINLEGARAFVDFLTSSQAQELIGSFGVDQYGQPLFVPDADKNDQELSVGP